MYVKQFLMSFLSCRKVFRGTALGPAVVLARPACSVDEGFLPPECLATR